MAKTHKPHKNAARKTARRKPSPKKAPVKPTTKKAAKKAARRRKAEQEPVAHQAVPCDCEANTELGIAAEHFTVGRSVAKVSAAAASSLSSWRVAKSLLRLRAQVNAEAPSRSKSHDGTIGDANHQNSNSDHNPWVDDGVVTAMDITHDPANGCDADDLAEAIRAARDNRVKYLIWNRRICNHAAIGSAEPWIWRPYNGSNPHDRHLHISVKSNQASYDDESDWPV